MKKFFLLMALVLMAGVVQAQNTPNFGNRANLKQAKRANSRVSGPREFSWSANNQYYSENGQVVNLFNNVQNNDNIDFAHGATMASTYENFVIRVSGLTSDSPYSVEFYDLVDSNNDGVEEEILLHTFTYWKDDVHISPLRSLFSDAEINRIHRVKLKSSCNSGSLTFEEAYFISALQGLDYTDKDGVDIGNAYIDPSYLIRSNRIWVDINESDRTFTMNLAPELASGYHYDEDGKKVLDGVTGTLSFSLPYESGIDMSEVTFTALDFNRTANILDRCIYENRTVDLQNNPSSSSYSAKDRLVRDLYNSRYNGPFYDQLGNKALAGVGGTSDNAIKHVNSIYWQASGNRFETQEEYNAAIQTNNGVLSIQCQDMSFTKNTIKARTTRKPLNPEDWTNRPEGFRNLDYPVRPYFRDENNWSDVVRGYWDGEQKDTYTDLSRFNKMRISGSPNTVFNIRYATSLNGNEVTKWEPELHVKTDARGEANIDLDIYPAFYMQLIYFDGLYNVRQQIGNSDTDDTEMSEIRKTHYVNNVELFEGEGRLVDLVGSTTSTDTGNMFHVWNNDNNYQWQYATIVRWACPSFESHLGTPYNLIWGTNGLYAENYADLTGYKAIRVYGNEKDEIRFIFNTKRNGYTHSEPYDQNNPNPDPNNKVDRSDTNEDGKNVEITLHDDGGVYAEFDISNFEYFHLNGIKALYGKTATVTAIKLVEDEEADYVFYGNGSYGEQGRAKIDPTVAAATQDQAAKVIDTRARCNNMQVPFDGDIYGWVQHLTLPETANPNLLFIERDNQFVGRDNLIVPSNKYLDDKESSANFSEYFTADAITLQDGFSFYAPKKIKAGTATYTRTFKNNSAAVNSIILPFAVSAGNDETYGFYETDVTLESTLARESGKKVGILEEQDVDEGDWLLQFKKTTGNTKANTPYLYAVESGGKVDFIGVKESGTVIIPETPDVLTKAKDNMTNNNPDDIDPTYDFYLRGVYEGTYMEHILFYGVDGTLYRTPFMTVTPFRTIIKSPIDVSNGSWETDQDNYFKPANGVKVVLAFNPHDDSSDINEVVADGLFAEDAPIYNVAGQRVNTFGKGIYIVGGKKILVK